MSFERQMEFNYQLCAVLFGTDESILNVSLKDGFSFVKRSLHPKDHLDKVFDMSDIGLRRAYETARINESTLDIICIEKNFIIKRTFKEAAGFYDEQVKKDLVSLDNQIRAIRLIEECALRIKTVSVRMQADGEYGPVNFNSMIPISESFWFPEISKFHCECSDIQAINTRFGQIHFPLANDTFNVAHRFYDLSYHEDNYIALTLLIVALEMLYLKKGDEKKIPLAKRCAVYMSNNRNNQIECYNKLTAAYRQRSEFVHDGIFTGIDNQMVIFLRGCVRDVLINEDPITYNKAKFIQRLKSKVEVLNADSGYWSL